MASSWCIKWVEGKVTLLFTRRFNIPAQYGLKQANLWNIISIGHWAKFVDATIKGLFNSSVQKQFFVKHVVGNEPF